MDICQRCTILAAYKKRVESQRDIIAQFLNVPRDQADEIVRLLIELKERKAAIEPQQFDHIFN